MTDTPSDKPVFPRKFVVNGKPINFNSWNDVKRWVITERSAWARMFKMIEKVRAVEPLRARIKAGLELLESLANSEPSSPEELAMQGRNLDAILAAYSRGWFPIQDSGLHRTLSSLSSSKEMVAQRKSDISTTVIEWLTAANKTPPPLITTEIPSDRARGGHTPSTTAERTKQAMRPLLSAENTMKPREFDQDDTKPINNSPSTTESGASRLGEVFAQTQNNDAKLAELLANKNAQLRDATMAADETLHDLEAKVEGVEAAAKKMEAIEELHKSLSARHADFSDLLTKIDAAADRSAKQAAETYTAQRILEDPAEYWYLKSGEHGTLKSTAFKHFWRMSLGAGFAIPILTAIVFFIIFPEAKLSEWATFLALIGAPALLAVWIIRLKSKEYLSQEALKTDADERVTMMKVYLSLIAQGNIPDEDRHLMLRALFRPANTTLTDDPMPGWLGAVVDQLPKPKTPGT